MLPVADIAQVVEMRLVPVLDDVPLRGVEEVCALLAVLVEPGPADVSEFAAVGMVAARAEKPASLLAPPFAGPCAVVPPRAEVTVVEHAEAAKLPVLERKHREQSVGLRPRVRGDVVGRAHEDRDVRREVVAVRLEDAVHVLLPTVVGRVHFPPRSGDTRLHAHDDVVVVRHDP